MALTAGDLVVATDGDHIETDPALAKIYTASVTLTDAQVKALPSAEVTVVAAPGAGRRIEFLHALLQSTVVAAWTNIHADAFGIFFKLGTGAISIPCANSADGPSGSDALNLLLGQSSRCVVIPTHCFSLEYGTTTAVQDYWLGTDENAPLKVWLDNFGAGDLTGGNAGNALKLTVLYAISDLG